MGICLHTIYIFKLLLLLIIYFLETAFTEFISIVFVAAVAVNELLGTCEKIGYLNIPFKCEKYYLKIVCLIYILHDIQD